jgi:hypothetical protein
VPSVVEAQVAGSYFGYHITDMPDIDQRRGSATGILGLPNNGAMYCVPTATTNDFAYIANHGYPNLFPPGAGNWQLGPPNNTAVYNSMTNALIDMGTSMGTDPVKGTGGFGALNGAQGWLDFAYPGEFVVSLYYIHASATTKGTTPSATYAPNLQDMTMQAIDDNLVVPGVGWYTNADTNLPHKRVGGHQLSLVEAHGGLLFGPSAETVGFSDPAADTNLTSQSTFTETQRNVHEVTGTFSGIQTTLSRFDNYGSAYLDNYLSIRPEFALAANNNFIYFNFPIQLQGDLSQLQGGQSRAVTESFSTATGGKVIDLAVSPEQTKHPYIVAGSNTIWQIDDRTGQSTMLATVRNPERLVYGGPDQSLYVLTNKQIVQLGRNGQTDGEIELSVPIDTMAYDSSTNELVGVSMAKKKIYFFNHNMRLLSKANLTPPASWNFGAAGTRMTLSAEKGTLLLHADGSTNVLRMSRNSTGAWQSSVITLQGAKNPLGLSVNEVGHMFVTDNNAMVEYDATGQKVTGSKFNGLPGGQVVQMLQPFNNFDPRVDTGPAYQNVLPENAVAPVGQAKPVNVAGSYQGFATLRDSSQAAFPVSATFAGLGTTGQQTGFIELENKTFTFTTTIAPSGVMTATGSDSAGDRFTASGIVTGEGEGALSIAGSYQATFITGSTLTGDIVLMRGLRRNAGQTPNIGGSYNITLLSGTTAGMAHGVTQVQLSQAGSNLTGVETTLNADGSVVSSYQLVGTIDHSGVINLVGVGAGTVEALQGQVSPTSAKGKKAEIVGSYNLRATSDITTPLAGGSFDMK